MQTALKIIGILGQVGSGIATLAGALPPKWGAIAFAVSTILHSVTHTVGDLLDDGTLNDSFK